MAQQKQKQQSTNPLLAAAYEEVARKQREEQMAKIKEEQELKALYERYKEQIKQTFETEWKNHPLRETILAQTTYVIQNNVAIIRFSEDPLGEMTEQTIIWEMWIGVSSYPSNHWNITAGTMTEEGWQEIDKLRHRYRFETCPEGKLASHLLIEIAHYHEFLKEQEEQALEEEKAMHQREQEQARELAKDLERIEQQEQARLATLKNAQEEDAQLRIEMANLIAAKNAETWQWPEGIQLTYYEMEYSCGSHCEKSGEVSYEVSYDYEHTITLCNYLHPVTNTILVYKRNSDEGFQEITLEPKVHRPVWTKKVAQRASHLPGVTVKYIMAKLPDVAHYVTQDEDENTIELLKRVSDKGYTTVYSEVAVVVPVKEIRDELDRLAALATQR